MTPPGIPRRCQLAWDVLNGRVDYRLHLRRSGWYSTRDLFAVTGRPSTERKVRELRDLGLVDWRKVPDHKTGGEFVEFKVAAEPGNGREVEFQPAGGRDVTPCPRREGVAPPSDTRPQANLQPGLSDSSAPQGRTVAPAQADLFHVEPKKMTREEFEKTGKATR